MSPKGFEELCGLLLRNSGLDGVEVTGRSGDGGIDGKGILKIADMVSFPVVFQCKKWSSSVRPSDIREFRGGMTGEAQKGIFITTGSFTNAAREEATKDSTRIIDLVDGDSLAFLLKKRRLGVNSHMVEEIIVDTRFFEDFGLNGFEN